MFEILKQEEETFSGVLLPEIRQKELFFLNEVTANKDLLPNPPSKNFIFLELGNKACYLTSDFFKKKFIEELQTTNKDIDLFIKEKREEKQEEIEFYNKLEQNINKIKASYVIKQLNYISFSELQDLLKITHKTQLKRILESLVNYGFIKKCSDLNSEVRAIKEALSVIAKKKAYSFYTLIDDNLSSDEWDYLPKGFKQEIQDYKEERKIADEELVNLKRLKAMKLKEKSRKSNRPFNKALELLSSWPDDLVQHRQLAVKLEFGIWNSAKTSKRAIMNFIERGFLTDTPNGLIIHKDKINHYLENEI